MIMRKLLTILASLLLTSILVSCEDKKEVIGTFMYTNKVFNSPNSADTKFLLIEMDSCEFIIGNPGIVHRARCKYCEARRKEELKQLVKEIRNGSEDVDLW